MNILIHKINYFSIILFIQLFVLSFRMMGQIPLQSNNEVSLQEIIDYNLLKLQTDPQDFNAAISLVESYYRNEDFQKCILYANISEDILLNLEKSAKRHKNHDFFVFYPGISWACMIKR